MRAICLGMVSFCIGLGSLQGTAHAQKFDTADIGLRIGTYVAGGKPISCSSGKRELQSRGFRQVKAVNCKQSNYTYRASRGGARYEIVITRDTGRIVRRTSF